MVACSPDAKRFLGSLFGVLIFLWMLFQISLFGSFHFFLWPILFPMIYTAILVFLEQKRGTTVFAGVRLVMWLIWLVFSFVMVILHFVTIGEIAKACQASDSHPACIPAFEGVILELVVFIFLLPSIFILACSCAMVGMTFKECRAPAGSYDDEYASTAPSPASTYLPPSEPTSLQSGYNTL